MNKNTKDINNLELSAMSRRTISFIIDDLLITFLVIMILWDNLVQLNWDLNSVMELLKDFIPYILFIKFSYQSFFIWYFGATIGKIITKIKVIDYNTLGKISLISAMIRSGLRLISEMYFYFGFIFGFFNDGRQTLHDKLAKTLVVNV